MIEILDSIFIWSGRVMLVVILWAIIISIGWFAFDKTRLAKNVCHFIYDNRDEWGKFLKKEKGKLSKISKELEKSDEK